MTSFVSTKRLTDWVEALSTVHLPRMPRHRVDLDQAPRVIAEQLYADPALVLSMIRTVHSKSRKHVDSRLHSMEEAVILVGSNGVRQAAESLPRAGDTLPKARYRGYLLTCERAIHAAVQARRWANQLADLMPNEVYTAAMMRHVAELAMWVHPDGIMESIREIAPDPTYATQAEYVTLGFSLAQLNHGLAKAWGLPYLVTESAQNLAANTRSPRTWTVGVAVRLAGMAQMGWEHPEMFHVREALGDVLNLAEDDVVEEVRAGARETTELLPWRPVTFASLLKDPAPPMPEEGETPPLKRSRGGVCLAVRWPIVERVRTELRDRNYDRSGVDLDTRLENNTEEDRVMNLVLTGLFDGLGLSRVMYAQLGGDRETVQARLLRGTEGDPVFHRFRVDTAPDTLIREVAAKPAAIWVRKDRYKRLQPRMPAGLHNLAGGRPFFLASIFANGKLRGLVYADRHRPDNDLDKAAFGAFRELCALGGSRLSEPKPG